MSEPEDALVLRRSYPAPRERVFRAWTDAKELERWYTPGDDWKVRVTELSLRPGGRYRVEFGPRDASLPYVELGVYETIDPPSHLVFRTTLTLGGELLAETRCTIDFTDRGESTDLVLTETGFPAATRQDRMRGWGETLDNLSSALEQE